MKKAKALKVKVTSKKKKQQLNEEDSDDDPELSGSENNSDPPSRTSDQDFEGEEQDNEDLAYMYN